MTFIRLKHPSTGSILVNSSSVTHVKPYIYTEGTDRLLARYDVYMDTGDYVVVTEQEGERLIKILEDL